MNISKWLTLPKIGKAKNGVVLNGAQINGINSNSNLDSTVLTSQSIISPTAPNRVVYIDDPNTWIKNDGLLRDEGVLFGLLSASIEDKLASIISYFEQQKATHLSSLNFFQQNLEKQEKELGKTQEIIAALLKQQQAPNTIFSEVSSGKVIRYFLGLALMVTAAIGSFYIVNYYITPFYGLWSTLGIFFFGLFAQMTPVSSWLQEGTERSKTAKYKEWLLEIGPSVVTTLLTSYIIFVQTADAVLSLFIGLFLLFLFFFNGKLILGLTQTLIIEVKHFKKFLLIRKVDKKKKVDNEAELKKIIEAETELKKSIVLTETGIKDSTVRINELEEEKKNKLNLFSSEYNLAKHFSSTLKDVNNEL